MNQYVTIKAEGPVTRVTLNRPEVHNAFDDALISQLHASADQLDAQPDTRVVVLAGAGRSFCAGADINWMKRMASFTQEENVADSMAMARMFTAWNTLSKPVIGRIHGAALGGGTGLTAVCDIPVAAADAVFAFSEVRLGILPAVISPFVVAKIGEANAREYFLTGGRFSAERALSMGLVQYVTAPENLDTVIEGLVQSLLSSGPRAQQLVKELLPQVVRQSPENVQVLTAETIAKARAGEEGQEGMLAYFEKRKASWREDA